MKKIFEHKLLDVYHDGADPIAIQTSVGIPQDDAVIVEAINPDNRWGVIIENQSGQIGIVIWKHGFQEGRAPEMWIKMDITTPQPEGDADTVVVEL